MLHLKARTQKAHVRVGSSAGRQNPSTTSHATYKCNPGVMSEGGCGCTKLHITSSICVGKMRAHCDNRQVQRSSNVNVSSSGPPASAITWQVLCLSPEADRSPIDPRPGDTIRYNNVCGGRFQYTGVTTAILICLIFLHNPAAPARLRLQP